MEHGYLEEDANSIDQNLECAYKTNTFQTILKKYFTNINATTSFKDFSKILGTQSSSQNR